MKRLSTVLSVALVGLGLTSCFPDRYDDTDYKTLDTVVTQFNPGVDFGSLNTFVLMDTVYHYVPEGEPDELGRGYDNLILERVRQNMLDMGYTELANPSESNPPDAIVVVGGTSTTYIGVGYVPGGCWYPYDPYCWGGYYPWYGYSYEYTIGSIVITMLDRKNADIPGEILPVAWVGALNGPLDISSTSQNQDRIKDGIDQAYDQSPYLETR